MNILTQLSRCLVNIVANETVLMKVWGLETTPLSTAKKRMERSKQQITQKAHSFISTVLAVDFLFNRKQYNNDRDKI